MGINMALDRRGISKRLRARIMVVLRKQGDQTTRQLATDLDVGIETVHYHLRRLESGGAVCRVPRTGPGSLWAAVSHSGPHPWPYQLARMRAAESAAMGDWCTYVRASEAAALAIGGDNDLG